MEETISFLIGQQRQDIPFIGKLGKLSVGDLERICDKVENIDITKKGCWVWNGTVQDKFRKGHQHGCIWSGKTQAQVAAMYGVHKSQVSRYWNGVTRKL